METELGFMMMSHAHKKRNTAEWNEDSKSMYEVQSTEPSRGRTHYYS